MSPRDKIHTLRILAVLLNAEAQSLRHDMHQIGLEWRDPPPTSYIRDRIGSFRGGE